jgi:rod shape-determining protein MreC
VEKLLHGMGLNVRSTWSSYVDLRNTRQQNRELKDEVARLRLEQAELAQDALQGQRLQTLLNFQRHYVTSTVAAQVIGTSGTDQSRVLYIDKGSADGLKPDQAVITPDGIVGKIRETMKHTSQILLINDPTSGAGVLLASTRIRGILHGSQDGHVVINNLTPDSRIKPGEKVLTSGGDQIYPRGLNVGTIQSITPDPDHQPYTLIAIKPAANLFQLEEVLVITGTQDQLPALAEKDLAKGVATAKEMEEAKAAAEEAAEEAAARSAAQIIAEKLPSLHQDQKPADGNAANPAAPVVPPPPVPKPVPTLHSDRYTPGSTPPASSLKPGAENQETTYTAPPDASRPSSRENDSSPKPAAPKETEHRPKPASANPEN